MAPPKILVVDDNQELLSLLTQLFEEAGYQVLAATKGKSALELARTERPKLGVFDILLPDMMGYHLAEQVRKELPEIPLIFITGVFKGGRHAAEAKMKFQAAGYFEKPFEAQKLVEAVGKLVAPEKAAPATEESPSVEIDLSIDVMEEEAAEPMELTGKIKVTGGDNLSAEIKGQNFTVTAHTPPVVAAVPAPAPAPMVVRSDGKSRQGELKDNLPSLITAFYMSKETGELGVQKGKVKKVVYFEKGQPMFALSNLLADRFGQFLVRVGKVKQEDLSDAAAVATQTKRRTGDVLVERGLLKDGERMYYVGQQVKSIIYSLFGWEEGAYQLIFRDKVTPESIKLDIHPANLIVRGVKKLYKPERLKRMIQPSDRFIPSLQPDYQLSEVDLEKWEGELLPKVDGSRSVTDLVNVSGRPEHVILGSLAALQALNVLEKRK